MFREQGDAYFNREEAETLGEQIGLFGANGRSGTMFLLLKDERRNQNL